MAAEPIGENNPLEAILLTAFPNPERIGCPAAEVIHEMAEQRVPSDDPTWSHLWNCSPCFRDFKTVRDARVARVERDFERKRTRRQLLFGAAAAILASLITYFGIVEFRSRPRQVESVTIDLPEARPTRGDASPIAHLPKRLDEIHLLLPAGSSSGHYAVAILQSASDNTAIALTSASTQPSSDRFVVVATLDLSGVSSGKYFLGTRRDDSGQPQPPLLYPVMISE